MDALYKPLVTIVIPCYNRERYVSQAIESVLNQTYHNIELIVVDDGSTDSTVTVIRKYGIKLKLIKQSNKGVSAARNTGLSHATGEFIVFLDSDDWLSIDIIESHITTISAWPQADAYCADCVSFKDGARIPSNWPDKPDNPKKLIFLSPPPSINSIAYRTSKIKELKGYDEQLRGYEDSDLNIRMSCSGSTFVSTDGGCSYYRPVENSLTKNVMKQHYNAIKSTKKLLLSYAESDSFVAALLKEKLIRHRLRMWYHILNYHLSIHPLSILKFTYHFFRISRHDPGYLLFIFRDRPWQRNRSDIF